MLKYLKETHDEMPAIVEALSMSQQTCRNTQLPFSNFGRSVVYVYIIGSTSLGKLHLYTTRLGISVYQATESTSLDQPITDGSPMNIPWTITMKNHHEHPIKSTKMS